MKNGQQQQQQQLQQQLQLQQHPIVAVRATTGPVSPDSTHDEPVIRLRLDKPRHWEWELTTTADRLPVIQLLDRDGRLLVETTGKTAQKARGSFREGLIAHQEFPGSDLSTRTTSRTSTSTTSPAVSVVEFRGNRNFDGFSSKFGMPEFQGPRKSRSEVSVRERKSRKRQSSGVDSKEASERCPRYSTGDYLRQQIIDDLRRRANSGRSPEEIARDRCKKVKAYLRTHSDSLVDSNLSQYLHGNTELGFEDSERVQDEVKDSVQEDKRSKVSPRPKEDGPGSIKGQSEELKDKAEELSRIKAFLRDKIQMKMDQERSQGVLCPETMIQKRNSEYRAESPRTYRTRKVRSETNIVKFEPEVLSKTTRRGSTGRSQSVNRRHPVKRDSSSLEKRKLYRKTKSDVLLGQISSIDSEQDPGNPPRRIRSQDNMEESWREYKERKKHERLHKETEVVEEDFMSKPRWKDLQADLCSFKNCKVCQNMNDCVDPFLRVDSAGSRSSSRTLKSPDQLSRASERPGTSLQENYIVVDSRSPQTGKAKSPNSTGNETQGPANLSSLNSPDCGYNSIPKKAFKDYKDLYSRTNVKKSDTFKIVDGSEDQDEVQDTSKDLSKGEGLLANKSNEDIARDYFKRVYELLKKRQEEAKRNAEGRRNPGQDDSSSSNYVEEVQRRRHRRRRKERIPEGEEVVTVPPAGSTVTQDPWKPRLDSSSPGNRRGRPIKRAPPPPPPPPPPFTSGPPSVLGCRVNVNSRIGDIDRYFDRTNKENNRPLCYAVNEDRRPLPGLEDDRGSFGPSDGPGPEAGGSMGSNLSRHNGKGLNGRRTQSSGNLCEPKGRLNTMGKILVPCSSSAQRDRYKFCGSLPNHLDDKDALDDDDPRENNNIMPDTITGNLGGTLPHKKRSLGVHFSDGGPTGALDLVKHRSQDSLDENDPWRYQQSDLDLVRCRHGNFDSVRRNRSVDTMASEPGARRYSRGASLEDRCQRNSDLDLVGTLPKRRPETRNLQDTSSSQPCIASGHEDEDDLLMKIVHKPDCELVRHRQQMQSKQCIDLKLSRLAAGEPQDQGYASERSPEDEHPPSLPGQPFPSVTPESTFRVTLQKSSRGLGLSVSGGGTAGPVRVKRLFPQQPAALSNKLQPGDILLAANGIPLTGLTNYEALEVLRTTPSTVELVVCRLPGDTNVTPPGAPPPPPARREPPPPLRILNPLPPLQIEPCGEFDIEMTKVGGSLGFTLRKADSSALGHYVRALVREPALSDGRIRPGDKIVAVDGAPLSPMSHEEAVQLLRQCGPTVRLRLYRDLAQTPVSALSPTEPDHPLRPPRTSLRQEAVDMLCDLAVRKLSPGTSSGSSCKQSPGASCNSPRRLRRLATRTPTTENEQELQLHQEAASDSDQCSIRTQITNSQPQTPDDIIDPPPLYDVCDSSDSTTTRPPAPRPSFLDLSAPPGKPNFQFCSLDSDGDRPVPGNDHVIIDEDDQATNVDTDSFVEQRPAGLMPTGVDQDNDLPSEPASMPPMLSSTSSAGVAAFSYKNPAYQSANPACGTGSEAGAKGKATHSSDQDIPGKILGADDPAGSKGLLKWKGVMFAPDDEGATPAENEEENVGRDTTDSVTPSETLEQGTEVFMVELTRGWNSRLGFSLQPEGNRTVISVVHPDSVAAKDGRLKQGDVLMMVNDESVEQMSTADIIDLLRKIRGSIGITVMRRTKRENIT